MAWSGLLRWIERPLGVYFTFKWRAMIGVPLPAESLFYVR